MNHNLYGAQLIMNSSVETAIDVAVAYAKVLQSSGVTYAPWNGLGIGSGPPFWIDDRSPTIKDIEEGGTNCVGLINLISVALGNAPQSNWFEYLEKKDVLEPYVHGETYPQGTMIHRRYRDIEDQGHVGMVVSDTELIHSYMYVDPQQSFQEAIRTKDSNYVPGVTIEPIDKSHSWFEGGTYTHVCRPEHWLC
jgi:hypothetical protein